MLKWMCAAGTLLALASPALAQKPADRMPVFVTGPDVEAIREGVNTVKQPGECLVEFTIGVDGKAKDIKPTCTPDAYGAYAVRAMATVEYLPEIFDGEVFETEGVKQPFKFGVTTTTAAAAAPGDKAPVKVKDVEPKEISRAMNKIDIAGTCNVVFVVGADGKPKDIKPGCTPAVYDKPIGEAIAKMRYTPGENAGKAIDWPNMTYPLNLTKPE